ncbi:MAG: DUF1926 domain-containing protein [Candidatus Helarchaeota archaeon]|nr:DUF1926 domain-containing protein [Candidatus Helarchaeota archaeon]
MIDKISEQTKKITPVIFPLDIDKDGQEDILVETALITLYMHAYRGGSVYEIDHKEKGVNILNAFQRRKEAYYEKELEYIVDRWRRYAFYDHFVKDNITLEEVVKDTYDELGNFMQKSYKPELKQGETNANVRLFAEGQVILKGEPKPLKVSKFFEVLEGKNEIRVTFTVENLGNEPIHVNHLCEIPLYITGDTSSIIFKCGKAESDILENETLSGKTLQIHAQENDVKVKINLVKPPNIDNNIFKYNLETLTRTNGGNDSLYQGTVLAFITPIKLNQEETLSWKMNITLA